MNLPGKLADPVRLWRFVLGGDRRPVGGVVLCGECLNGAGPGVHRNAELLPRDEVAGRKCAACGALLG